MSAVGFLLKNFNNLLNVFLNNVFNTALNDRLSRFLMKFYFLQLLLRW